MAVPSTSTGLRGSSSADISSILPKLGRGHKSASVSSTPVPLNISNNSTSTIVDSSPTCISSVAQKIPTALATVAMAQTSSAGNSNIGIEISPRLFLNNVSYIFFSRFYCYRMVLEENNHTGQILHATTAKNLSKRNLKF